MYKFIPILVLLLGVSIVSPVYAETVEELMNECDNWVDQKKKHCNDYFESNKFPECKYGLMVMDHMYYYMMMFYTYDKMDFEHLSPEQKQELKDLVDHFILGQYGAGLMYMYKCTSHEYQQSIDLMKYYLRSYELFQEYMSYGNLEYNEHKYGKLK